MLPSLLNSKTAALAALCAYAAFEPVKALGADLVRDGEPCAEIVLEAGASRSTRLAAMELQDNVRKISGATLAIVEEPHPGVARILMGRSRFTDALGIPADDLPFGAFRIRSGPDWLALLGDDTPFTPIEPWGHNNADLVSNRPRDEWRKLTNSLWGTPNHLIYKERFTFTQSTLPPNAPDGVRRPTLELWAQDERGSFNAVIGFLHHLGARWYAPGALGEVLPSLPTIPLPTIDLTVKPDFPIRRFNVRPGVHGPSTAMWALRLGMRNPYGIEDGHGLDHIFDHPDVFAAHPDWFAMYGGKRRYEKGANNHLCYSNEAMLAETVRYVRAVFDHYNMQVVSIMPADGYTAICQCSLCEGKGSPEREQRGSASDYIWEFVNRVAAEVRKTHPDRKVMNCAYGIYSLPPLRIGKLEPNVVVSIVGGRRPMNNKPEQLAEAAALREGWLKKTDNPIIIFENYPFTDRGWYLPSFTPHSIGASINATKGVSQGEDIWLTVNQEHALEKGLGINHFMVYLTQRMYWGGPNADPDALFREYVRLFYGPAEAAMNAFFDFCEQHWQETEKDKAKADRVLALFDAAKNAVPPESIHAKRLALIDSYLEGLRNKSRQLGKLRGPLPALRLVGPPKHKIVVDGRLDDLAWTQCPVAATGTLRELQTGRIPTFATRFKSAWLGNDLYFAIECDEPAGQRPAAAATKHDDGALWMGDAVELLIETESNSYYQIAVDPAGHVCDLDRSASRDRWFSWNAKAEVATHIEDGRWTVEIRLPIRPDTNDPLNQIIGHHPTRSLPWYINVCRQRIREDGTEHSAYSPTGTDHFHLAGKFATFFDGNSFQFEHGTPDEDFLLALKKAEDAARQGNRAEALAGYQAAAELKATPLQRAHALELAARFARGQQQIPLAESLIAQIPIEASRHTAWMQHLSETARHKQLTVDYAGSDPGSWPFWKRGEALAVRGQARVLSKLGPEAETDLRDALPWIGDPRQREPVLLALARNAEDNLKDAGLALTRYRVLTDANPQPGTAAQIESFIAVARLLSATGSSTQAGALLRQIDQTRLPAIWQTRLQAALESLGKAAPQPDKGPLR